MVVKVESDENACSAAAVIAASWSSIVRNSAGVQDGSATNGILHELRDVSGFVELVLEGRLWVVVLAV